MGRRMAFEWSDNIETGFRRETVTATHDLHTRPQFSDAGLSEILDAYPREKLGIYKFPPHAEGHVKAEHGRAPDLAGAELLEAVRSGHIWLNLRAVNAHLDVFREMAGEIFGSMERRSGERVLKPDVGLLISSPNIHVHYHLDIPVVALVQVRGVKTLHLYPARAPFAPDEQIEAVVLRESEEDVAFRKDFEAEAQTIELQPGMALTWPQNAPHRVQNSDSMNVSLSCEFMTLPALIRANAIFTNGLIRRRFGGKPSISPKLGPATLAKAAIARAAKLTHRVPEKGPTPLSFELSQGGEIKPLSANASD